MIKMLHNQDSGGPQVEIHQVLDDALARAERVLEFCQRHVLGLPSLPKDHCWHAGQALLRVMHGQLEAAQLYAENHPHQPSPIIVSVRPIYEAMLYLHYLLQPEDADERRALGWMFWAFHEWETIEAINKSPGGSQAYEDQLTRSERPNYKQRLEIAEQAETRFTPEQKRQLQRGRWSVTWTGRSIKQLAKDLENALDYEFLYHWYRVMSMATHISPGMIHWAYKLLESEDGFGSHATRCMECSAEWLNRGSVTMLYCSSRFLDRYDIDMPAEGSALIEELKTIRRGNDQERLSDDPDIRDLVDRIVQAVHPVQIVLFGSMARDEKREHSDFDVLVVLPDGTDVGRAESNLYRSMRGFPVPTDFIAVTEEDVRKNGANPNMIIHTALREGEEVYPAAG